MRYIPCTELPFPTDPGSASQPALQQLPLWTLQSSRSCPEWPSSSERPPRVFFFFKPMTRFETLKSLASLSPAAVLTRHTLVLERKKKKNRLIRARRCRSTKKSAKPHYPAYRELESWSRPCIIQPVQMHNKVSTFIYPLISLMFQLLLSDVWKCWRFVQLPTQYICCLALLHCLFTEMPVMWIFTQNEWKIGLATYRRFFFHKGIMVPFSSSTTIVKKMNNVVGAFRSISSQC